jgi:hypothetical protein
MKAIREGSAVSWLSRWTAPAMGLWIGLSACGELPSLPSRTPTTSSSNRVEPSDDAPVKAKTETLREECSSGQQTACSALKAMEKCASDDAEACGLVGITFLAGLDGMEKDSALGLTFARKACEGGRAKSCTVVGIAYSNGESTAKDPETAARFFGRGCAGGHGGGCSSLGMRYARGVGVTANKAKARELYLRGCNLGDGTSCGRAGRMLADGEGGERDAAQGAALIKKACELGDEQSCRGQATSSPAPTANTTGEGTIRFKCPNGETPEALRSGCGCGREILNPCKHGGNMPSLDGDVCVFQCAPEPTALPEPQTEQERCEQKCNDESGWRRMGECERVCAEAGKPVVEQPREDPRKKARAALPGLLNRCRVAKARIIQLKAQVMAARRAHNYERIQELQPEMQDASDKLMELSDKIEETISAATDDEQPEAGRWLLQARQACVP